MLLTKSMAGDQPEVLSPLRTSAAYGHPQAGAYVPNSRGSSLREQSGLGPACDEAAMEAEAARPHHPVRSSPTAMQHADSTPQPLAGLAGASFPQHRPSAARPQAALASAARPPAALASVPRSPAARPYVARPAAARPSTVRSSKAGLSGARQAAGPSFPTAMPNNSTEHVRKNSKAPGNSHAD